MTERVRTARSRESHRAALGIPSVADPGASPSVAPADDAAWCRFRTAVGEELDAFFAAPANRVPTSPGFGVLWERVREHMVGGKLIRPRLTWIAWSSFAGGVGDGSSAPDPLVAPDAGDAAETPGVRDAAGDGNHTAGDRETEVPNPECVRLAASFEMLHAALLVHDDVVDRDWLRRGMPTVGELFRRDAARAGAPEHEAEHAGASAAILAGDLLLAGALRLATTCASDLARCRAVADVVFDAVTASAAGELDDVLLSLHRFGAEHPGVQDILDMERLKTATYSFEAPLRAGALLAGAPADVAERLAQAGAMLGVGYQVVDDVLGTFGDPGLTGKSVDADLRSGKATVLTAHGRRIPAVRALLDAGPATPADIEAARRALEAAGAREHALDVAAELTVRARERIAALPLDETVRAEFADACHAVLTRRS